MSLMGKTPERPLGIQVDIRQKERPGHFMHDRYGVQSIEVNVGVNDVDIHFKDGKMVEDGKGWQVSLTLEPEGVRELIKRLGQFI